MPSRPLVVTLTLDQKTQSFLTSLRTKYFPSERNHLGAHITLFHAIPPHRFETLDDELNQIASSSNPFDVFFVSPSKMGSSGVMIPMRQRPSGTVERIHRFILDRLMSGAKGDQDRLTDQDTRDLGKVHVTVLNKADKGEQVDKCLKEVIELFKGLEGGQHAGQAIGLEA